MELKIRKLRDNAKIEPPAYKGDAGYDVYSTETVSLLPGEHYDFNLGFSLEFDKEYVCLALMKSGLASKFGIDSIGTVIDSSYRGEIHAQIVNPTNKEIIIEEGKKIIQLLFLPIIHPEIIFVDELTSSERGENKFGSSGE
jgi:dUTP pyrophosphatase